MFLTVCFVVSQINNEENAKITEAKNFRNSDGLQEEQGSTYYY